MRTSSIYSFLSFMLLLCIGTSAIANVNTYTDRTVWNTAAGGSTDFNENFASFGMDTDFSTMTVSANGFTIQMQGPDLFFRNFIETPPFQFTDNNGSNHASCFTNADGGGTTVELVFDNPVDAWIAEFTGICGLELLDVEIFFAGGGSQILQVCAGPQNTDFGVVSSAPEGPIERIQLRSRNTVLGGGGEGFGLDNVSGAFQGPSTVPTMGEWGLIILALLVLSFGTVFMMRRKTAIVGAGEASMSQSSGIPFDRASFGKMLAVIMIGLVAIFTVAVLVFGYEMTSADVPGALIAGPIGAYLLHLLFGAKK